MHTILNYTFFSLFPAQFSEDVRFYAVLEMVTETENRNRMQIFVNFVF